MSFRTRTVIGIALIEAVFLLVLVWMSAQYLQRTGGEELTRRAQETAHLLALMGANAVITSDLATLGEMVEQVSRSPDVRYIRVVDERGVMAQAGAAADLARPFRGDHELAAVDDGVFDTAWPVEAGGLQFADVQVGISTHALQAVVKQAKMTLSGIALAELLIVALVSVALGSYLTRGLRDLKRGVLALARGDQGVHLALTGSDELSDAARAFNFMTEQLQREQTRLKTISTGLEGLNRQLAGSEQYLRTVLDSVIDGIITIDSRGLINRINPAGEALFGYDSGELIGQNVACLMPAPHAAQHDGYIGAYLGGGPAKIIGSGREVQGLRKDGSTFTLDLSVSEMVLEGEHYFVGVLRDKTARQQLEAQARRSEKIKAMITDANLDAMVTVDMDGFVVEYNKVAEATFGWRRDEIIGQLMENFFIPEEMRELHRRGMASFKATGKGPLIGGRVEVEAVRKSGERIPVELSLVAAEIDGERLATAFLRDISARKRAEQELIDARDAAEQASQAKSRFLSHMSHEIRSPLNAVLGAVNLIAERVEDPAYLRLLQTAQSSGSALLAVINEILDFSKIEAGHITITNGRVAMPELVEEVLAGAQARMEKPGLDLLCQVDPAVGDRVISDPVRIRQVINILVDNAVKFTDQGLVAVDVRLEPQSDGAELLVVEVQDTGVGIPAENLQNVFNEFEQVDATRDTRYGGTGLGLTIARRLVELLGGEIGVESQAEQGSCFRFSLPVSVAGEVPEVGQPPHRPLILVTPNTALQQALSARSQAAKMPCQTFDGLEALARQQARLPRDAWVLIDERAISALGAAPSAEAWGWLSVYQGRLASLCSRTTQLPAPFDQFPRIDKPLACRQLCEFASGEGHARPRSTAQPAVETGRLLLVEDVSANRLVASEMLRSRGYQVVLAEDGLDGLEQAGREPFDVILMDIRMPRLNGIDAVERLRREPGPNATTPVIALTANAERSEMERCRKAGMDDFVSKPFDAERLISVIKRCQMKQAPRRSSGQPLPESGRDPRVPGTAGTARVIAEQEGAPETPREPLLVGAVLDQLVADTSEEALVPMLDMFLDELQVRADAIAAAFALDDADAVREQAHALKSCAGTFGAQRLQALARELEEAARSRQAVQMMALTEEVARAAAATRDAYQDYRRQVQPA